ncbi:adhesion G-protein coupled receptor F3 [Pseudophryne corroboree]|uniref:adhesion G-protein coupled receptor F3 n=1 Tax=Pseudophryne corroboree TaxID=495146 RepID=UPI003081A343
MRCRGAHLCPSMRCRGAHLCPSMRCIGSRLPLLLLLFCAMRCTMEMKGTVAEGRVRRSTGGVSGRVYVQVIARNALAGDHQLVKDLLTSGNLSSANPAINITVIAATTECTKKKERNQCECLSGFLFDISKCKSYPSCYIPQDVEASCICTHMNSSSTIYCEQPPTNPGRVSLFPSSVSVGNDIRLEFSSSEDVTNVRWFMMNPLRNLAKEVTNGTTATVITSRRNSTVNIKDIPRNWEGLYVCRFSYWNLQWKASHQVKLSLQPQDITPKPPQVQIWNNSTSFPGTTVECCIWDDGSSYRVFWEPGHIPSVAVKRGGQQCYSLTIETIPENDTHYRCLFQDNINKTAESGVRVAVIQANNIFCPDDGENMWKATKAGYEAEIPCPYGKRGRITRSCLRNGRWGIPNTYCVDARLWSLLEQSKFLQGGLGIPEREISPIIERLRNYTTSNQTFVNSSSDIITVVDTIKALSLTATDNHVQFNFTTMADLTTIFSQFLNRDSEAAWLEARTKYPSIGSNFMQSVENFTKLYQPDWNDSNLIQPNVQLSVLVQSSLLLTTFSKTFNMTPTVDVSMKNIFFLEHMEDTKVIVTSMVLRNLAKVLPMNFEESIDEYSYNVDSHVVINTIVSKLSLGQVNLEMVFGHEQGQKREDDAIAQCVFWDYRLFEGVGGWSTEGCWTSRANKDAVCRCTHLTAFAVLRSLGVLEDVYLETISQVGVSLSIISLVICILIYIAEWKSVVKNDITFLCQTAMINICLSVLIGDTWFLSSTFMTKSYANKLCISAAYFQHLFYLASFFWMLVHGLLLLHQQVFAFHQLRKSIAIPIMMAIGYICPLVIASVTLIIDYPKETYLREGACFINGENGSIFAFSGPVLLVVIMNFFTMGVVIWKILRPPISEGEQEDRKSLVAKAVVILTSVFGVTWILETILTEEAHEIIQYAFTLINSFQGVFIALVGCLLDKKVMAAISKRFRKLQKVFPFMACCEGNSYRLDSSNEQESVETYRSIGNH